MPLSLDISDEQLIKKTAEGSDAAFEQLMGRYLQVLYSYISIRASESDAADILQETMLAAWRGITEFVGSSTFKTWLFAIARRKICDFYRDRSRSRNTYINQTDLFNENDISDDDYLNSDISFEAVEPMIADPASDISERLDAQAAINSLSKEEREIVFMIFEAGLSYTQISEVTGIPVGTIKSRMSAVKSKLKRFLGDEYDKL